MQEPGHSKYALQLIPQVFSQKDKGKMLIRRIVRNWFPFVLAFLVSILICGILWLLVGQFKPTTIPWQNKLTDTATLHVLYPDRLPSSSLDELGTPLIIYITESDERLASIAYTVSLADSDRLLVKNSQGQLTGKTFVIIPNDPDHAFVSLYIQQAPQSGSLPSNVDFILRVTASIPLKIATVVMHPGASNPIEPLIRSLADFAATPEVFAGIGGILIGLVAAKISLDVEQERRNRERVEQEERNRRERIELIQSARQLVESNIVAGLERVADLRRRANRENWEESLRSEISNTILMLQGDPESLDILLVRAGEAFSKKQAQKAKQLLENISEVYSDPLATKLCLIEGVLFTQGRIDSNQLAQAFEVALQLWNEHNASVQDLIVPVIVSAYTNLQDGPLTEKLTETNDFISLVNQPRVQEFADQDKKYQRRYVREFKIEFIPPQDDSEFSHWRKIVHLNENPFGGGAPLSDPLLLKTWNHPTVWNQVLSAQSYAYYTVDPRDRDALLFYLRQNFSKFHYTELSQSIFPIYLALPFANTSTVTPIIQHLENIARACAEAWIEVLTGYTSVLFKLSPSDQVALSELLYWQYTNQNNLVSRFRQEGMEDGPRLRALVRGLGQQDRSTILDFEPSSWQFEKWFGLRPPGLEKTFLIVNAQGLSDEAKPFEERLSALASLLGQHKMYLKLFTSSSSNPHIKTFPIDWKQRDLVEMLQNRIAAASEPVFVGRHFSDFFDPYEKPADVEAIMAHCAHGSLNRMLDLGNLILQARVKRGGITNEFDFYLTREDLLNALKEFKRLK